MSWYEPDPMELMFWEALALIAAACLLVPLFRRLGLGTVLGYLAGGVAVGYALSLRLEGDPEELLHFAEFGVVLFLFVIGLELNPTTLWAMRRKIFGLGGGQVMLCGLLLAIPPLLLGMGTAASIVIGFGLALSSTALVMQTLDERGERRDRYGRATFSILLFQDLAIVPLLLLINLLAPGADEPGLAEGLIRVAIAAAAIVALILIGHYLLDPLFGLLARARLPEIMTASALGVVIAAALIMDMVGMSYAMGAFMAGVLLADSSYRHEVEANIEPFRGLFLGLFFMAVGISLDLRVVADNALLIVLAVPVLMLIKALAIYAVARIGRMGNKASSLIALSLAQHGEFGFVMFASATTLGLISREIGSILVAIITVSMAISPMVDRLRPLLVRQRAKETMEEDYSDAGDTALIVGFGRVGQIVAQSLLAGGIPVTVIDNDADRVREARRFGSRVHFGDGTRRDVLRAAGAGEAELIAICTDGHEQTTRIIELVHAEFSQAHVVARTYDRIHSIQVADLGLDAEVRETFESAVTLGGHALTALGLPRERVRELIDDVRQRDSERLREQIRVASRAKGRKDAIEKIRPEPLGDAAEVSDDAAAEV